MSNALPMALLRPSCAALRPPPVTQHWNSLTLAFARRFCSSQQSPFYSPKDRPSVLSALRSSPLVDSQCRLFSSTLRSRASVDDPLSAQRRRTVRIGPLPTGNVDDATIRRIFGGHISGVEGNHILRILQHRRTSGSLADYGVDNLGKHYVHVTREQALKGLEWLREMFPVDEARAAQEWAEREANRIAYELWLADPENDSKYKDPARAFKKHQEELKKQQEEYEEEQRIGMLRVGKSQFDRNIEEKRRQRLEAVTKKAEEKESKEREMEEKLASGEWVRTPGGTQLMKPGQTAYVDIFGREQVSRRAEMLEKYRKMAQTPFKSEEEMLKSSSTAQRLYPMTAFVFFVCVCAWGFAHYYIPPSSNYRLFPDWSPTTATMGALIGLNFLVCALWRVGPLWPFMSRWFMHTPGYPRAFQAVGNTISHVQYEHLFSNMMFLGLAGTVCHDLVDRGIFLGTYVAGGAVGSLFTLYWANLGKGVPSAHSVGASACIWAISALYLLVTDQEKVKIPITGQETGFYPLSLLALIVAVEVWTAFRSLRSIKATPMDHASHFGGLAVGLTVGGYLRATGFNQKTQKKEGVQQKAGVQDKTVDVGALVKEEAKEVKESISKAVK